MKDGPFPTIKPLIRWAYWAWRIACWGPASTLVLWTASRRWRARVVPC